MEYIQKLSASVMIVMTMLSCTKEGVRRFEGNYTFKTGGTIEVMKAPSSESENGSGAADEGGDNPSDNGTQEKTIISLIPENGQMNILTVDKNKGDMIVTMNILGGSVLTFDAKADGKLLTLEPLARQIQIPVSSDGTEILKSYTDITVGGYGEKFDDVVIFRLSYAGNYTYLNTEYVITDSSVDCVAKKN